jgi:hypothetical protein
MPPPKDSYCSLTKPLPTVNRRVIQVAQVSLRAHAEAGYFEALRQLKEAPNSDQLGVLLIGDDKKNHALQGADSLAYEINKHTAGFTRGSFKVLCELPHAAFEWNNRV